ncbi:hypothetical protein CGMCC3_g17278 [Colletotrichum fructicola]|nr:uncharacterized protein CGMCC3_g17278 [Colletotrichum fructicola]KAE9566546.1 hypothetical protein CGMCC3_g17278 [Colletotrichum fructicola]
MGQIQLHLPYRARLLIVDRAAQTALKPAPFQLQRSLIPSHLRPWLHPDDISYLPHFLASDHRPFKIPRGLLCEW